MSAGQTGADRAALDLAIQHGIPHGGWCPKGRLTGARPVDQRHQLKETPSGRWLLGGVDALEFKRSLSRAPGEA